VSAKHIEQQRRRRLGVGRADGVHREPQPGRGGVLDEERHAESREPPAADLLGQVRGVEALLARAPLDGRGRVADRAVTEVAGVEQRRELLVERAYLAVEERRERAPQRGELLGDREVHARDRRGAGGQLPSRYALA
jgi:hypothetical protein